MNTDTTARSLSLLPTGGPTVLIHYGPVRLLVDPTFDQAGDYPVGNRALVKTAPPAIGADQVGPIDAVLLSHDQHADNLDHGGRALLRTAPLVLTTTTAAARLDATTRGLEPWQSVQLGTDDQVTVTAVPAQHGPDGSQDLTGPVIGFVLTADDLPTVYISGDNAALRVVQEVADHWTIDVAVLFAGAARTPLVDGFLTLTSEQAVQAARILDAPRILPVHTDGWAHFTQDGSTLIAAFTAAGLSDRLLDSTPGSTSRL